MPLDVAPGCDCSLDVGEQHLRGTQVLLCK